jgi:hypothetical protein
MELYNALETMNVGDFVFVACETTMYFDLDVIRFDNIKETSVAKYMIDTDKNNNDPLLRERLVFVKNDNRKETKKFPKILDWEYEEKYFCFLTEEEAIVWKLLHIQEIQQKVMNSLKTTVESMNKKFKRLNIQKKIQNYSDKYPEHFLKNI